MHGKFNSRALRQLAEELFHKLAQDDEVPDRDREDFVTSLVRQWITYDGNATLWVEQEQFYLVLGKTPLGKPVIVPEPAGYGWLNRLTEDWKISPDGLPEIIDQLNRGQSAEAVNADGIPLRLWVNPKERSKGVEPLVKQNIPPATKRNHDKIAADVLEQRFGRDVDAEEMAALARSVAKQWQEHEGHACLFVDGQKQLCLKLTEHGDGGCDVAAKELSVDLESCLSSLGCPPEIVPEAIARINLGQEIEFQDRQGDRCRLWHDPKARKICTRPLGPAPPQQRGVAKPAMCPKCTGVFMPWQDGERQKTCIHCGHTVTLS